jgi:hypothetical protein
VRVVQEPRFVSSPVATKGALPPLPVGI